MSYVDGFVTAVPSDAKAAYLELARMTAAMFKENGALSVVEAWEEDVPDGTVTDFRKAVQAVDDEVVVFSWVVWPDKATRDAGGKSMMEDERMKNLQMPFDGKRMIYGGFATILEV